MAQPLSCRQKSLRMWGGIAVSVLTGWICVAALLWLPFYLYAEIGRLHWLFSIIIGASYLCLPSFLGGVSALICAYFWRSLDLSMSSMVELSNVIFVAHIGVIWISVFAAFGTGWSLLAVFLVAPALALLFMEPLWKTLPFALNWWRDEKWREFLALRPPEPPTN